MVKIFSPFAPTLEENKGLNVPPPPDLSLFLLFEANQTAVEVRLVLKSLGIKMLTAASPYCSASIWLSTCAGNACGDFSLTVGV